MMFSGCPGQDKRNIKVESIACTACGYAVEIFSDEARQKCPKCGNWANRQKLASCALWCKSARECIGEERWEQLIRGG
ncbi:MAG: phosphohydrolase [Candidatus Omnitrophota bacterium]